MFYYGLDFHDLAPNFILNISAFIIVRKAFFRIQPHFGLWLKIFSVKPKVVQGRQAECGGAMVGKIANVTWLEGAFVETIKGANRGGFISPSHVTLNGQRPLNFDPASHPAHILERDGPVVGQFGRGDRTPNLRPRPGDQEGQACQRSPGYAHPPDPPVSTTGLQSVGAQPGAAPNSEQALRHNVRRCLEGAIQGRRGSHFHHRRSQIQCAASSQRGKLFYLLKDILPFIV